MKIIGLTGSIGMGKSTVAAMFADEDVPVFDADAEVHHLQGKGGALVAEIESAFPGSTTDGAVDRHKLGVAVFGDPEALKRLEAIVHPVVARERAAFLSRNADAPLVVFDIPLLLEKGRPADIDAVVVVSAPADIQRARVLARPGMTAEKFDQIIARQLPDAQKRALADHIIDTGTDLAATRARVHEVIACLTTAMGPS
jgi:dephospho-CoA kinase